MVLVENIRPGAHETVYDEYFPSLAVLDTQEILERVGSEWKNPGPTDRHSVEGMDAIFIEWIDFFDEAKRGHKIVKNFTEKGVLSGDTRDLTSFMVLRQVLGGRERYPGIIMNVRASFVTLLSEEAQRRVGKGRSRVKVDEELRQKIDRLVAGVGDQMDGHYHSLFRRIDELEND